MHKYTIKKLLNIPEYKVVKIISMDSKEIHIRVKPYKRKKPLCSGCWKEHQKGYHSSREVIVEDKAIGDLRVYLHVKKRRYRCDDGCIYTEHVNWIKKWSRTTKRFSIQINRLTAITTNQEAGWFFGLDDERVYRTDKDILQDQARKFLNPPPAATSISVDEVSYRKYYRYLTNVIDIDKKIVIWNDKGRKAEVLDRYYKGIGEENCRKIESVALDGAKNYISSTNRYAVNATIVYDKFHIIQKLNKTVDMVRKIELRKARADKNIELIELMGCRQRFVLLKNKNKLSEKQKSYLDKLCEINNPIYKAMLLKESFLQIYLYHDIEEIKDHLREWFEDAFTSGLEAFQGLAYSFLRKVQYIINWFKKKISSAISEGFNNKIKRLKRMAYGYKDIEYFKLKIHQHCGLLNPRYAT